MANHREPTTLRWLIPATVLLMVACTSAPRGVTWHADQSCQSAAAQAATYEVAIENMPGFIEPAFAFAAHQSMQRLGLLPGADADLLIRLRFEQTSLDPPARERDDFDEVIMPGRVERFDAIVHVSVEQHGGEIVWSGAMNRRHAIIGNETFHEDRAIVMLQQAFDGLLKNLLTPCQD